MSEKLLTEYIKNQTCAPFHMKRIGRIVDELQNHVKTELYGASVWEGIVQDLYGVFHLAAIRTLIAELHICKDAGKLRGANANEEYESFCRLLAQEEYQDRVYNQYPGLRKYLDALEEQQRDFWQEVLTRLELDFEHMKTTFWGAETELQIRSIRRSGSDFHCHGKSVVLIETNQKERVFYKPHTLANELFLQEFLVEICESMGLRPYHYPILDRKTYGWVKEVTYQECTKECEVAAYYKRIGILSAVSYILGMGDLHYENLIAHGEYPVVVDAETLFQNLDNLYRWKEKTVSYYSVLSSALFPGGPVDKSLAGITGGTARVNSQRVPTILYDKTSDMQIGYRTPMAKPGRNQVRYQGKVVDYYEYQNEIITGFADTYEWFMHHKLAVQQKILRVTDVLHCRYVSGSTQFFALTLSASTHPDLMTDEEGRERYVSKICAGRNLGKWETEAILRGDIPWFYRKMEERNLYTNQGAIYSKYFNVTIVEQMWKRFEQMSDEDCILQKKTLQLALEVFGRGQKGAAQESFKVGMKETTQMLSETQQMLSGKMQTVNGMGRADWTACAKQIAKQIAQRMISLRGDVFFLGMEETAEGIRIKPVDIYFYGGIAGIAVFLRKLHQECLMYGELCDMLEGMLFSYTERLVRREISPASEYSGMYCGEGSMVYAYQLLYRITGDEKYRDYAGMHCRSLARCIGQEQNVDLLYGNAGAILVLCQQYEDTNSRFFLDEAYKALEYLEHARIEKEHGVTWYPKTQGNPICSMAHGNSGILLAYARLNGIFRKPAYVERMKQIVMYEDHFWNETKGNWPDLRKDEEAWYRTYAWCNSGVGMVYARAQALKWNPEQEWLRNSMKKGTRIFAELPIHEKLCLCHGNMGNYLILRNVSEWILQNTVNPKIEELKEVLSQRLSHSFHQSVDITEEEKNTLEFEERNVPITDMNDCGFMNGLAGIGMGCLIAEDLI